MQKQKKIDLPIDIWMIEWQNRDDQCLIKTPEQVLYLYNTQNGTLKDLGGLGFASVQMFDDSNYLYRTAPQEGESRGLYIYDPKKEKWRRIASEEPIEIIRATGDEIYYVTTKETMSLNPLAMGGTNKMYYLKYHNVKKRTSKKQFIVRSNFIKHFVFSRESKTLYYVDDHIDYIGLKSGKGLFKMKF